MFVLLVMFGVGAVIVRFFPIFLMLVILIVIGDAIGDAWNSLTSHHHHQQESSIVVDNGKYLSMAELDAYNQREAARQKALADRYPVKPLDYSKPIVLSDGSAPVSEGCIETKTGGSVFTSCVEQK